MNNNTSVVEDLLIFLLVPVLVIGVLYFYPFPISWVWHWITLGELHILSFFDQWLPEHTVRSMEIIRRGLENNPPGSIGWRTIWKTEVALFPYNSAPYALLLIGAGIYVRNFATQHHMRHTTETLIEEQTRHWRFSRIWVKYNPLKDKSVTKGPFRIPPSATELARQHNLIHKTLGQPATFDRAAAEALFRERIGEPFSGLDSLTRREHRWLAAAMLPRADGDKATSDRLLGDISYFYADEFDADVIDKDCRRILKKYRDHAIVQRLLRHHGFVQSFFVGLYLEARICGKFTTSMFPWLILEDRELFFTLNNYGRPSYFVEGLAGIIHYDCEIDAGFALHTPTASIAAESLRQGLVEEGILEPSNDDLEKNLN